MKKPILTVTLNPALDRTIVVKNFKSGKTFFKEKEFISAGGKGLNVSRALNYLNIKNIATGLWGGDSAKTIRRLITEEKIPVDFIEIKGQSRVNLTIVDKNQVYQKTRILGLGPKIEKKDKERFVARYKQLMKRSSWVILSGRNPQGASPHLYAELIHLAQKEQIPTVLDTSDMSLKKGIVAKPNIVKPNKPELEEFFSTQLKSLKEMKKAIVRLQEITGGIVLLSLADKGAVGFDGCEIIHAIAPKIKAVNDVGCGDSFLAGYMYGLLKNESFKQCIVHAVAAGALNAMTFTPGRIIQKDLCKTSKKIIVKSQ